MFFVFASVFIKGENDNQNQISSDIIDFDDMVNGGNVVPDGFLENNDDNYEGNNIAKGVLKVGEIFVRILNKGVDLIISGVKMIVD
jgi:hypothetical protein